MALLSSTHIINMKDAKNKLDQPRTIPGIARDFFTYSLGKDIDGNKREVKELQKILLDIVLVVDKICRKNNIPYALAYGSALGIQNYAGFIPWDDDVDIAIDYYDIPRFIEALKEELPEEYYFHSYETDERYNVLIPTLKIRKKNTYVLEANESRLPNRCDGDGIFIDVVAFMGVPKSRFKHFLHLLWTKALVVPYFLLNTVFHLPIKGMKRSIKMHEEKLADKYKDSDYIGQTYCVPFQNWGVSMNALIYPKDVIYPFKEYEFEGHKLYSFNNVYEFCKIRFGKNCFNVLENGEWVNKYPQFKRRNKHFRKFSLSRDVVRKKK